MKHRFNCIVQDDSIPLTKIYEYEIEHPYLIVVLNDDCVFTTDIMRHWNNEERDQME